jgi:hypothetical protein
MLSISSDYLCTKDLKEKFLNYSYVKMNLLGLPIFSLKPKNAFVLLFTLVALGLLAFKKLKSINPNKAKVDTDFLAMLLITITILIVYFTIRVVINIISSKALQVLNYLDQKRKSKSPQKIEK